MTTTAATQTAPDSALDRIAQGDAPVLETVLAMNLDALERSNHDASLFLIQLMFGWVSDSTTFIEALAAQRTVAAV